jgi:uncharacterized repeat protein (TIGR02543 family)
MIKKIISLVLIPAFVLVSAIAAYAAVHPILEDPDTPPPPFEVEYVVEATMVLTTSTRFEIYAAFSEEPISVATVGNDAVYTFAAGAEMAVLWDDEWSVTLGLSTETDYAVAYIPYQSGYALELTNALIDEGWLHITFDNVPVESVIIRDSKPETAIRINIVEEPPFEIKHLLGTTIQLFTTTQITADIVFSKEPVSVQTVGNEELYTFTAGTQMAALWNDEVHNAGWAHFLGLSSEEEDFIAYIPYQGGYALELTDSLIDEGWLRVVFDGVPVESVNVRGSSPTRAVRLRVVEENISAVTVNGSQLPAGTGAGQSGAGNHQAGATVTINAGTRANFNFTGWTVNSGGVTLASASSSTTTFVMPTTAVTVTANWAAVALQTDGVLFSYQWSNFPWFANPLEGSNLNLSIEYWHNIPNVSRIEFQWLRDGRPYGGIIDSRNIRNPSNLVRLTLSRVTPWEHNGMWSLRATTYVNGVATYVDRSRTLELVVNERWHTSSQTHASTPTHHHHTPAPMPGYNVTMLTPPQAQAHMPSFSSSLVQTAHTPASVAPSVPVGPVSLAVVANGVNFSQPAVLTFDGTLIPVRETFQRLGFSFQWNQATRTATATRDRTVVTITDGSYQFTHNGFAHRHNNQPAQTINGVLMMPFEQVLNSIGVRAWRDASNVFHMAHT